MFTIHYRFAATQRAVLALVTALLVFAALADTAWARGIEVRSTSPELMAAEPGEIISLSFRVFNNTPREQQLEERVLLPEGWNLVMPVFDFLLGPGIEVTRVMVVQSGRGVQAGDYDIFYSVTSVDDPAITGRASVGVAIQPVRDLSLDVEGLAPEQAIAGDHFTFNVRIVNQGNTPMNVEMKAEIPGDGAVSVEPSSFTLPPRESLILEVSAHIDPDVRRLARQSLRLEAITDQVEDGRTVTSRLNVPLEVVPLVAGEDIYHRFPLEFSLHLQGDDHDEGTQFTLRGDGYLDEEHEHRLAFAARAPDREGRAILARREEYWVRYNTGIFGLRAGDQSYGLSELTSQGRYGRGAGVDIENKEQAPGGGVYHVEDRWGLQERKDTGGYLAWSPGDRADLRLNILRLDYESWDRFPSTTDDLASVEGSFRLRENDTLDVELGYSSGDRYNMEMSRGSRGNVQDVAYRINYRGSTEKNLRYTLSSRVSGPDFSGRYSDTARHSGSVNIPFTQRVRLDLSYQRYERNLKGSESRGSAPREDLYRSGVNITLPKSWRLGLNYSFYDRSNAVSGSGRDLHEHMASVSLGRSSGPFSYRVQVRQNWTDYVKEGTDYRSRQVDANFTWRPSRKFFTTLSGGLSDDKRDAGESYLAQRGQYLGGSIRWQPTRDFSIFGSYRWNERDYPDEPLRERTRTDHYSAGVSWRLPNQHQIRFDARRTEGTARDAYTTYYATYTIPLNVPLGRKQSVGSLKGRVSRADAPGSPGVAGAVVYVDGTAARTDQDGWFEFRTLPPGDYELTLDERSIDLGTISADGQKSSVTVTGGRTVETEVHLTDSGSLEGWIIMVDPRENGNNNANNVNNGHIAGGGNNNNNNNQSSNANGNILVEMARDGEVRRTITDREGRFLFEQLVPGDWTLKVYDHNLPEHHYLENGNQEVVVKPGKRREVRVRVIPRLRQIRFIDEGRISAED